MAGTLSSSTSASEASNANAPFTEEANNHEQVAPRKLEQRKSNNMVFNIAKRVLRMDKLPAIVTFVSAIIAFSLSLVVLLSSGSSGQLVKYDIMMLNTSTLLQNAVKVESAASTTARRALMPRATSPPSIEDARLAREIIQRDLISDASTFFAGFAPTATTGLLASATSALGAATSIVGSAFGDIGTLAGQEVEKVINDVVEEVLDSLGVQEYYTLYMMEFCGGKWSPNYADPNAVMNVTNCTKYSDLNLFSPSNSTVTIGQTRLDFSALNIPNKLSGASGSLSTIFTLIFALQVIGVVSTGLLIVICPVSIALPIFNGSLVRFAIAGLASLAAISLSIDAIILAAVPIFVGSLINKLAGDLGAQAHVGGNFIAMAIVSSVFMAISASLWFIQWFDATFTRRSSGDKIIEANMSPTRLRIGAPVLVKTPQDAYDARQESGTVRSV